MAASGDAMPQRLRPLPGLVQAPGHLLVIAAKCVRPTGQASGSVSGDRPGPSPVPVAQPVNA